MVILPHFSHDRSALQDFSYKYFFLLLLGVPKQVHLSNTEQNRQSVMGVTKTQTPKTQTSDPENSDPENSDPENSDPENSGPENSDP